MYLTGPAWSFTGILGAEICKAPPALLASAEMLVTERRREEGQAQAQSSLAGGRCGVGEGAEGAKLGVIWGQGKGGRVLTWSSMGGGELGGGTGPQGARLVNIGRREGGVQT